MTDTNLNLFKKALTEGLSNKIDLVTDGYTAEVKCTKKHTIAMRTILRGKMPGEHIHTPQLKWVIAIALSVALILTGCAIKFREKIAGFFTEIFGSTIEMTYADQENAKVNIDDPYEFTYVPDGYVLESSQIESSTVHRYIFVNGDGLRLICDQIAPGSSAMGVYNDNKTPEIYKIGEYEIYCKSYTRTSLYIWNKDGYTFMVTSDKELTIEDITYIVHGVVPKR